MTITVLDFEKSSLEDIMTLITSNRHLGVSIETIKQKNIENWSDDHPMNKIDTAASATEEHFKDAPVVYKSS